jgi:hypothetical protein
MNVSNARKSYIMKRKMYVFVLKLVLS